MTTSSSRRLILKVIIGLGAISGGLLAAVLAWAAFSSTTNAQANTFAAGSLTPATISDPAYSNSPVVTWTSQAAMNPSTLSSNINYVVMRKMGAGSYAAVMNGGCSGSLPYGTASCTDTDSSLTVNATYSYEVVAHFSSAWAANSNQVSAVYDTVAPAPTVTAPANGGYTNSTQPALAGTAGAQGADASHSADASTVTVNIYAGSGTGGTLKQTFNGVAVSTGSWSIPGSSVTALTPNAQYTVQVTQTDGAGNSGSGTSTFVIDTAVPAPTVTAPANGGYVNVTQPALAGTAGSQVADASHSADASTVTVNIYAGSGTGGTLKQTFNGVAVSTGSWSIPGSSVTALAANAQYTVQVTQTDGAGNSGSGTSTFVIDTAAPAPTVTAPANGSYTNSTQPALAGTAGVQAADASHSADGSTVTVNIYAGSGTGGTLKQTFSGVAVSTGSWSIPGSSVTALAANAQYTVQVTQTDGAGNSGSGTSTFVIDTAAPAPTVTAPANGGYVNLTQPALAGTAGSQAADASHSADTSTVTVNIYAGSGTGGTLKQTFSGVAVSTGAWSISPSSVTALTPNAQYTVQVTQTDGAGNSGSGTSTFVIDTTAPAVTLTAPANGSYTNQTKPTFSGAAGQVAASSTTSADLTTVTVNIYAGSAATGTPVQTLTTTESSGAWSVSPTTALTANAQYTAQATQADAAGNLGTSSANTFVVDTTAPVVTLTAPANGATVTTSTPTFSGAAGQVAASSSTSADSTTVTVYLCTGSQTSCNAGSGTLSQTLTTTETGGSWSVASAALSAGEYTAQASQSDGAGNTGTSAANGFTFSSSISITSLTTAGSTGSTAGQMHAGDPIVVGFSQGLAVNSICSAWSGNTSNHTDSTATVNVTGNSSNNTLTIAAWSDCPTFHFGSIDLGSMSYVTSSGTSDKPVTFTSSTVAYNATTHMVTITLGTAHTGSSNGDLGTVTNSVLTLTIDPSVTGTSGQTVSPTTIATANIEQFANVGGTSLTTNSSSPCASGTTCTTASVTIANGATAVVLVHEGGGGTSDTMSLSGLGFTGSTSPVASIQFSSKNYLDAFVVTGNGTNHTLTVTYSTTANPVIVDVIQLSGNDTTTPIAQEPTASATTGSPTSTLTNPSATSGELVIVAALTNTAITTPAGFTAVDQKSGTANSGYVYGVYFDPAAQTGATTFTASNTKPWGSLALELNHA